MMNINGNVLAVLVVIASVTICAGVVVLSVDHDNGMAQDDNNNGIVEVMDVGDSVNATQTWTSGDCTCTLDRGIFEVSGQGAMADYTGTSVPPWDSVKDSIGYVIINDKVTHIGQQAFWYCPNIDHVTINNAPCSIGRFAFSHCSLLENIFLGNAVTSIGNEAFAYTKLNSIQIPDSVTIITNEGQMVDNCPNLKSISVGANNPNYSSQDGVLFNKTKTELYKYPEAKSGSTYTIPNSVVTVDGSAFYRVVQLTSITIPDSVTTLGSSAFSSCASLTSVTIPDSVTTLGSSAFSSCSSLKSVTIGNSVTSIGANAFSQCYAVTDITFLSHTWNITTIGQNAFNLGTSVHTASATIHSYQNVAQSKLDSYHDAYTILKYIGISCTVTFVVNNPEYGSINWPSLNIWVGGYVFPRQSGQIELHDVPSGVVPGAHIYYGNATPSSATAQYTYAFDSWSGVRTGVGSSIVGDMTITVNFTRTPVPYTVTFQSADTEMGTVSKQSVKLDYGTKIAYWDDGGVKISSGGTTYCVATPKEGFLFDHWDGVAKTPSTTTVTGNMTLTAYFKPQFYYRVNIAPNEAGWGTVDKDFLTISMYNTIAVADNVITITDQYSNATYTITATQTPSTAQYTYAFGSWSGIPEGGVVVSDTDITANFSRTLNTYTVTVQVDPEHPTWGTVDVSSFADIPYGTRISQDGNILNVGDEEPYQTQEATPQPASEPYRYLFNSWSGIPQGGQVVADITVTAMFQQTEEYIVTFKSNNPEFGSVDKFELSAQVGTPVTVSKNKITIGSGLGSETVTATPSQSTAQYLYTFVDWSNVPATITGDVTITANFDSAVQTYRVSFDVNNHSWGSVVPSAVVVDYGTIIYMEHNTIHFPTMSITVLATPSSPTARYDFAFVGWDGVPENGKITGATEITANFEQTVHQYTVTVVTDPEDGSYGTVTDSTVKVDAGSVIVVDEANLRVNGAIVTTAESKQSTAQYIYKFDNWTGVPTQEILEDCTITARFLREIQEYTITFKPADGTRGAVEVDGETILADVSFKVPFGTAIVKNAHELVVGDDLHNAFATAKGDYTFIGWLGVPEDEVVQSNLTISTQFETLTIELSATTMYCVSGMEAPWMYNPFTATLKLHTEVKVEGTWSIVDPNNTGLTIDKDTGIFGGIIKSSSDYGSAVIKVVFTPAMSNKEISATFTLYYEPKLIIVG